MVKVKVLNDIFFPFKFEAEEMAQKLRELPVIPENWQLQFQGIQHTLFWSPWIPDTRHMHGTHTYKQIPIHI